MQTQTKRHSFIVSLLGIKHVVVAINKMDLVEYRQEVFDRIRQDYLEFVQRLNLRDIRFIPISALNGDNVVHRSAELSWFDGPPLMELLNTVEIAQDQNLTDVRLPVQWVNRPNLDFRGYSGTVAAGVLKPGDPIMVLPSRKTSRVKSIVTYDGELAAAFPSLAITVTLEDDLDISRGDMLVRPDDLPMLDSRFNAHIVWMADAPLIPGKPYYIKQTTKVVTGSIAKIHYRIDVHTLEHHPSDQLVLNEIGLCEVALNAPIAFDPYSRCKGTGAFIVIDRFTNATVGAGMIVGAAERRAELRRVTPLERAARFGQQPITLWLTGAERYAAAYALERRLFDRGYACAVLDAEDVGAPLQRIAQQLNQAGIVCLCPTPDEGLPEEDVSNVILAAEQLDIHHVIQLLIPPQPLRPDFEI